ARAQLELVVESFGRPEDGRCVGVVARLPRGTTNRRAADHDRRRAAVIADGDVLIVREQRVVRTKHAADVRRAMNGRVEVRVVADMDGRGEPDDGKGNCEVSRETVGRVVSCLATLSELLRV